MPRAPKLHPSPSPPLADADLRPFMAGFPSGVAVVTALDKTRTPHGMTCSSLCSVALSPATLVVCIRSASPTLRALRSNGRFALNLLHEDARSVSDLFASGVPDRFARVPWRMPLGAAGPHLSDAAHAIADCVVDRTTEFGDHTAVFATVGRVTLTEDRQPLLYGRRRYARWTDAAAVPAPGEGDAGVRA
ncbi:flavin reductase family protein [Streptomyces sp. NPDC093097]|uniref:flavin reductase family protein n=1 Tax=Streptomyces sp. NPDC093097 TaxID=3366027 RepID=UPI0038255472